MAQKHFEAEIVINKPIEKVFDFTIDLDNLEAWNGTFDTKKTTAGPVGVDTQFEEHYKFRGKNVTVTNTIVEFERPDIWAYQGKMGNYKAEASYKFTEVKNENTKVTFSGTLEMGGPFQTSIWFHLLSSFMVKHQLNKNLKRLKKILEEN